MISNILVKKKYPFEWSFNMLFLVKSPFEWSLFEEIYVSLKRQNAKGFALR